MKARREEIGEKKSSQKKFNHLIKPSSKINDIFQKKQTVVRSSFGRFGVSVFPVVQLLVN